MNRLAKWLVSGLLGALLVAVAGCGVRELPPYQLVFPPVHLPTLQHTLDLGRARAELSASSRPVDLSALIGESSGTPPEAPAAGQKVMFLAMYCTNKSWDYPALSLGDQQPVLTSGGRVIEATDVSGGARPAQYRGHIGVVFPGGQSSTPVVTEAQVAFVNRYLVPNGPSDYRLTWKVGQAGTAGFSFRY